MKLRIRGDSIRLRLTQKEVAQIAEGRFVQETTHFAGDTKLHYTLAPDMLATQIEAKYTDHNMIVHVPIKMALAWAKSQEVALKCEQNISDGTLVILIEKDFFCLKPRLNEVEDETDMFTNPNAAHGSCG